MSNIQFNDSAQYSCEVISLLDHVKAMGSITVVGTSVKTHVYSRSIGDTSKRTDVPSKIAHLLLLLFWTRRPTGPSQISVFV